VGLVGDLDLRQAELNLARTASFIPGLRSRLVAALNRIAVLVGEYPPAIRTELQDSSPVPVPGDDLLVGLPADVLRQRPDVRSAERQLAAQTARIGVATADLYPRLALLGQISLDSTTAAAWFTGGAHSWGIGPQLRWNVFDGGRIRSNIQAQEALADQALSFYEQTLLLAVEEVENALTDFAEERNRYAELERSSEAAGKSVALVKTLYRTGLVDFLNVSESERSLFEEQDQLAASQGRVATNWIGIYRALGGGWQP
jgi:NodT family efflux transporter outer membrane factor (OMF) lipoprotein